MNALTLTALMTIGPVGADPAPVPTDYLTLPISANAEPTAPPLALPGAPAPGP
jgi:hypothetical protein